MTKKQKQDKVAVAKIPVAKALTHEVPAFMKIKIKTGIEWFDCVLGGKGLTPSQLTYFCGTPGCGKSTMMAILASNWNGNGGQAVYVSGEEGLDQICLNVQQRKLIRHDYDIWASESADGNLISIHDIIAAADVKRKEQPKKPFLLIVDSLQMMWDGQHKDGGGGTRKDRRVLEAIRRWCKEEKTNAIIIGQVNKDGKMAGSNFIKHMVDTMVHMEVEKKDPDMYGCRILRATKNRFGGCGHTLFLNLSARGFTEVARVSDSDIV